MASVLKSSPVQSGPLPFWMQPQPQLVSYYGKTLKTGFNLNQTTMFVLLVHPFKNKFKMVNILLRNKLYHKMFTKIVDFAEYKCI